MSVDDVISRVLWTKLFLQAQGIEVKNHTIYCDNQSSMKRKRNGKTSSGKGTRHFDIKHFYITDLIERGQVEIQYCTTDKMIASYLTKPLTVATFVAFRKKIMNLNGSCM